MELEQRIEGDVVVITVTGDITLSGGDVQVNDKVQSLLHQGYRKLILDLGAVAYVDSSGLGRLVQTHATTKNRGGTLKLASITRKLRDLLVVTKLLTVFDCHDSVEEAVKSFG